MKLKLFPYWLEEALPYWSKTPTSGPEKTKQNLPQTEALFRNNRRWQTHGCLSPKLCDSVQAKSCRQDLLSEPEQSQMRTKISYTQLEVPLGVWLLGFAPEPWWGTWCQMSYLCCFLKISRRVGSPGLSKEEKRGVIFKASSEWLWVSSTLESQLPGYTSVTRARSSKQGTRPSASRNSPCLGLSLEVSPRTGCHLMPSSSLLYTGAKSNLRDRVHGVD